MPSVTVNLDVTVDATGQVSVFGDAAPTMQNVLVANVNLPVSDLYRGKDSSLLKLQGYTAAGLDNIRGARDSAWIGTPIELGSDLYAILAGSFGAANAVPFKDYPADYHTVPNFGYVALGAYADALFGHVQATAAIDNDVAFVAKMIGAGPDDAKIGELLATAIFGLSDDKATVVAKDVIGQDASRAKDEDNDANMVNGWQAVEFKAGDIVYMSITLQRPTVVVSNAAQQSAPAATLYTPSTYAVKITLA